jgi:hypothetical protein
VPALLWPPRGRTTVGVVCISIRALLCILNHDSEVGNCPGDGLHWYYLSTLHATNWEIAFSLIGNRNLACGGGTRLDYCDGVSTACELGIAIITLGRLYFMLSCWLAPIDVATVQHGRCATARTHALDRATPSSTACDTALSAHVVPSVQ